MRRAIALLLAGFAALAVLVAAGVFTRVDQFAVDHLMPGMDPLQLPDAGRFDALVPAAHADTVVEVATGVWLFPASAGLSLAIVAVCGWALRRQQRARAAFLWPAALIAGTAIEVLTKAALARPMLLAEDAWGDRVHVHAFDQALPSGHTIRSVIVAAAIAAAWPRARRWAAAWAASVAVILVAAGWHTPTDVLAGLLLAGALVLAVHDLERRGVDRGQLALGLADDREPPAVEPEPADVLRR